MTGIVPAGVRTVAPAPEGATRLVLVRHGEARCNVEGVVGGPRGCGGLTALGLAQAEALRTRLEDTRELGAARRLYASVLPRALETAAVIAPAVGGGDLEVVADCALCELHPGEADGLTWAQFTERYDEPDFGLRPHEPFAPGGESWAGFLDRAAGALAALAERHAGDEVVVVCHAGVVEAAMRRFLPVDGARRRLGLRTKHASLTGFEQVEGAWNLLRYNDAAHLCGVAQQA